MMMIKYFNLYLNIIMPINIFFKNNNKDDKKIDAVIQKENGRTKTISFGSAGMSDYTIHKDTERKQRYLDRHMKNEDWNDYESAGFYATRLLWNKPSLRESINDTNNKSKNINIKLAQ